MKYRHAIGRPLWLTVPALALVMGGSSSALAGDDLAPPLSDRGIESILSDKFERLSEIEPRTQSVSLHGVARSARAAVDKDKVTLIDCDKGESINDALSRRNLQRAGKVNLQITGTCQESVTVVRPGVTLIGAASGTAVIDPPEGEDGMPIGPAIYALGAHGLTLEDLTLRGGVHGLEAFASRGMRLTRVSAVGNEACSDFPCWSSGVYLNASEAEIADSTLSSNVAPLWVDNHSTAIVADTVMENNSHDGPFSTTNSFLRMQGCSLLGNALGPQAADYSTTMVSDCTIESPGYESWSAAWRTGHLLIGNSEVHGGIAALDGSRLTLSGVDFGSGDDWDTLLATRDSQLYLRDGTSVSNVHGWIFLNGSSTADIVTDGSIEGTVSIERFSDAHISTAEPIIGAVECHGRSRVVCEPHPTAGVHGCE